MPSISLWDPRSDTSTRDCPARAERPMRAARPNPLPKWRLQRVQLLVGTRIAEPVTLADMAAAAGLSRMHFAAQFRAATGLRPHTYLLARRVVHAIAQMEAEDIPLAQLALAVGFQSQSHFSTVFKRLTGATPAAWRSGTRTVVPFLATFRTATTATSCS